MMTTYSTEASSQIVLVAFTSTEAYLSIGNDYNTLKVMWMRIESYE